VNSAPGGRIVSLDQFRGYTVAGMLLVNFVGPFAATPAVLKHHNTYCSYADTIMPQFLFAVGFAFRLTFGRRAMTQGLWAAYGHVARRLVGLALIAVVFYTYLDKRSDIGALWSQITGDQWWNTLCLLSKRTWCQTLMHIALTSLWILPVIRAGVTVRVIYLIFSAVLHLLLSYWFNFNWVNASPEAIDGGPLGFLTWSIPALVGTFCCDAITTTTGPIRTGKMLAWSIALMVLGYGFSCGSRLYDIVPSTKKSGPASLASSPVLPPFDRLRDRDPSSLLAVPPFVAPPESVHRQNNYWMMNQRNGTISYLVFSAGFSLLVFLVFYLLCDRWGWRIGVFRTFGTNALVAYILGTAIQKYMRPLTTWNGPDWDKVSGWLVLADFAFFFACTYLVIRILEWRRIFIRL